MFKHIKEILPSDEDKVGSKAYNCAILSHYNFGIGDGIVLYGNITKNQVRQAISTISPEQRYAVRSSMGDEDQKESVLAGKYKTLLNVSHENLADAINFVYSQGDSTSNRAVFVQRQIYAQAAGVIFTQSPFGKGVLINSTIGAGENVVSGCVDPDEILSDNGVIQISSKPKYMTLYHGTSLRTGDTVNLNGIRSRAVIYNEGKALLSVHFLDRKKCSLKDNDIAALTCIAKKLRNSQKKELDIEFAIERGKIYIIQMRPISKTRETKKVRKKKENGKVLAGKGVAKGTFQGRAFCADQDTDFHQISLENKVLVAAELSPKYIYATEKIGAIVTGRGGALSHAAIMAREMGIPCVTELGDYIYEIHDGEEIFVDAYSNEVIIYECGKSDCGKG